MMKPQSKWEGTEILANCGLYISLSQNHMTTWNTLLTSLSKTLGRSSGLKDQVCWMPCLQLELPLSSGSDLLPAPLFKSPKSYS